MDTCLVTGASGFIGSTLCRRLDAMGVPVKTLVRTEDQAIRVDAGGGLIQSLGEARPKIIFHLAARVHTFDRGPAAEAEHLRVTVEGTRNLLRAAIDTQVRAFIFVSSCAVMREGCDDELDESSPPEPTTPYGRAKLQAEELTLGSNGVGGMATTCIRYPTVYGLGHKGNLARMISAIERGVFPPLPPYPAWRSLIHVEDAVDAAILTSQRPEAGGKVYIVAEPRAYSSREIYDLVLGALGRSSPRWHVPSGLLTAAARCGDLAETLTGRKAPFDSGALARISRPARYSGARIERELGFKTSRTFATAVQELVAHRPNR